MCPVNGCVIVLLQHWRTLLVRQLLRKGSVRAQLRLHHTLPV